MKRFLTVLSIALLLLAVGGPGLFAQEEKQDQLWFCWEATVHPEKQKQFVEMHLDFYSKIKESGFPYAIYTWTDGKFGYYFFYPVDSYDDKIGIWKELGEAISLWGEENFMGMWETMQSHRTYFLLAPSDLSYVPDQPRLDVMDMPYAFWDVLYIKPGKEMEFEEELKKMQAILKETNFDDPVLMLKGDIGYEGSVCIGALKGKDVSDFRAQNKKMWELLGEEGRSIFRNLMSMLRKRDFKEFWYMEKLTYIPGD